MAAKKNIQALTFKQWLSEWDQLKFEPESSRNKPAPTMYMFSLPASQLRSLCGVFPRRREGSDVSGIQRGHDKDRSGLIRDFVRYGYPYCELSGKQRGSFDASNLKKPGWLPTAIVVNILTEKDERRGKKVNQKDLMALSSSSGSICEISLPENFAEPGWLPTDFPPMEVIDGQHRLFAFDPKDLTEDFELPVVAFHGLDMGWQAYIFWSINVSPKKINPSHAFDLYPLLRSQDWLEGFSETYVYREARAQELTDILYRHKSSPWHMRINMLGEKRQAQVTQAAWVRSLFNTYLSSGKGRAAKGLFGCNLSPTEGPLSWSRAQQAAFLLSIWNELRVAVKKKTLGWAEALRNSEKRQALDLGDEQDSAFSGAVSLLNQEQGVRGVLAISNDVFFHNALEWELASWEIDEVNDKETGDEDVLYAIESIKQQPFFPKLTALANVLAEFDWRSADAPDLSYEQKMEKRALRGSGGYTQFKQHLLRFIAGSENEFQKLASLLAVNED